MGLLTGTVYEHQCSSKAEEQCSFVVSLATNKVAKWKWKPPILSDVQHSGDDTLWPLSFLLGTMVNNKRAEWIQWVWDISKQSDRCYFLQTISQTAGSDCYFLKKFHESWWFDGCYKCRCTVFIVDAFQHLDTALQMIRTTPNYQNSQRIIKTQSYLRYSLNLAV